jgi:hypothetical protein
VPYKPVLIGVTGGIDGTSFSGYTIGRRKLHLLGPLIRHHRANESIFLYAFDLIELNGSWP